MLINIETLVKFVAVSARNSRARHAPVYHTLLDFKLNF